MKYVAYLCMLPLNEKITQSIVPQQQVITDNSFIICGVNKIYTSPQRTIKYKYFGGSSLFNINRIYAHAHINNTIILI